MFSVPSSFHHGERTNEPHNTMVVEIRSSVLKTITVHPCKILPIYNIATSAAPTSLGNYRKEEATILTRTLQLDGEDDGRDLTREELEKNNRNRTPASVAASVSFLVVCLSSW